MRPSVTRRDFLKTTAAVTAAASPLAAFAKTDDKPIRVVCWDEQQPAQKEAYPSFIGEWLAKYLSSRPGLTTKAVALSDPEQGLSADVLDHCDVLFWWGHQRHGDIKPATGKKLVERIKAGNFSLVALHSAHFSTPFMEAMFERTRIDAARAFPGSDKERLDIAYSGTGKPAEVTFVEPPNYRASPKRDQIVTPYADVRKFPDGATKVTMHLPYCCFPAWRADGKPSTITILKPEHPIAQGLPAKFTIPHTEMYDEPFHVPTPDERILEECWETGEWFPSGSVWKLGKGRVFYFRPGHETFPVYKDGNVLKLLENAARWLGTKAV
jgi:trehalose utilization protein